MQTTCKRTLFVSSALLVAGALHITTVQAQTAATQKTASPRGLTYDSVKDLPDWSGAWAANGGGGGRGGQDLGADLTTAPNNSTDNGRAQREIPPLRDPEALAKYKAQVARPRGSTDNIAQQAAQGAANAGALRSFGPGLCGFGTGAGNFAGRLQAGVEATSEFLFTPGRVTILSDHSMVRRIYTDRPIPDEDARLVTLTGTSIGHWEGDTLVVTTVGLSPHTMITGGVQAGKGFQIVERFYLDAKHTMHIDGTIVAPEVYTEPFHYTQILNRYLDRKFELAEYLTECDHFDRSIDRSKGTPAQTFDLTPPDDLPPPPAN